MSDDISNDNDLTVSAKQPPDPSGQAALLLVESLIHALIEKSLITTNDALEIVETAAEVKVEVADDMGDTTGTMQRSLVLLHAIEASLRTDRPSS